MKFSVNLSESNNMAIIGNLYKIEKQLTDINLNVVFDYFKQALNKNSSIHKRIFGLPLDSFEKVTLENGILAFEQVAVTKDRKECFIESHKKYIDFQLILDGVEAMEYIDIDKLKIDTSYDTSKDLVTYHMVENTSKFVMEKGDLAIYFPDDGHVGLSKYKDKCIIHKVVVKLPVELY